VKRRTSRKKFQASLRKFTTWARKSRGVLTKGEMLRAAKCRITGYLNYYAITDNTAHCQRYVHQAQKILFKWLNRKSQRRAYTGDSYTAALQSIHWPRVTVRVDLNPYRSAEVF